MTSSFTSLVAGGAIPRVSGRPAEFIAAADVVAGAGRKILADWADCLATFVSGDVRRMVFLGYGALFGATREAALKLVEMTVGQGRHMAQTYLGLRHGPMAFIDAGTLVVCFLSSNPLQRLYEKDLILELNAKKLGARKLIAGTGEIEAGSRPGAGPRHRLPGARGDSRATTWPCWTSCWPRSWASTARGKWA